MQILVIGSGGREHALAWKAAQDLQVKKVFIAPGNPGMEYDDKLETLGIAASDFVALADFAKQNDIALTIVGPEAPLVDGIVDYFTERNLPCFGPSAACARLEGSKVFAKEFLSKYKIPTAAYREFSDYDSAWEYAQKQNLPLVIKADGLAAGKGVFIAHTIEEVRDSLSSILTDKDFGDAGNKLIIEEFIVGEEASFMIATDGINYKCLANSQDHKHLHEGDAGPNTGGMGAYSPTALIDDKLHDKIISTIVEPTLAGMRQEGEAFTGFLYCGLMIDNQGEPYVLEYNVRLGDPETQVLMLRLQSSLVDLCLASLHGSLQQHIVSWDNRTALGVVMAASGYPKSYKKGDLIGYTKSDNSASAKVFFAGVKSQDDQLVTSGGRVLCVVAKGASVKEAQNLAYEQVKKVDFADSYYRCDIGFKEVRRSISS